MRKKLKDTGGLTMVELLCAVAILVLLCLMMNTGLTMAVKSYQDIVAESETELLLNSLSDALADKLRYAIVTQTKNADGTTTEECSIKLSSITAVPNGRITVDGAPLLPDGAYGVLTSGGDRRYKVEEIDISPNYSSNPTPIFTIKLKVKETSGTISAETPAGGLVVRCLNPVQKEETP